MGTMVYVRAYGGERLGYGSEEVSALVREAHRSGLPLLGGVDLYDDTVFNQMQCEVILRELSTFDEDPVLSRPAQDVRQQIEIVMRTPHRYLVFNGD